MSKSQQAALEAVKNGSNQADEHELSTGYTVRFTPVSRFMLLDATQNLDEPVVPVIIDEQQGTEYTNPNDPEYLKKMEKFGRDRTLALAEVILMMGVEVIGSQMPDDEKWLQKLRWLEKKGYIDLSGYDLEDPMDKEMAWKRYVVFGDNADFAKVMNRATGVDEDEVLKAMGTFQRDALRDADLVSALEESEELPE